MIQIKNIVSSSCVGIDFGTTYSLIGIMNQDLTFNFVPFDQNVMLRSIFGYRKDAPFSVKENKFFSMKKIIANPQLADEQIDGIPHFLIRGKLVSIIEIAAEFFGYLRKMTNIYFKQNIKNAVIAVPARFSLVQKNMIIEAAKAGGWRVLHVLDEPTAAIIGEIENKEIDRIKSKELTLPIRTCDSLYNEIVIEEARFGQDFGSKKVNVQIDAECEEQKDEKIVKYKDGLYIVYDLGGGTFDLSLVSKKQSIIHVMSTTGSLQIGGEHLNSQLSNLYRTKYQINISPEEISAMQQLKSSVDRPPRFLIHYKELVDQMFSEIAPLLTNLFKTMSNEARKIRGILCVGGAAHMTFSHLKKFRKRIIAPENPSLSIVKGLAKYAHQVQHSSDFFRLIDAAPFDIGIRLFGGDVEYMIRKSAALPAIGRCILTNIHQNQSAMDVILVQDNLDIMRFEIPIKPNSIASERIELTAMLNSDHSINIGSRNINTDERIEWRIEAH